MVSHMRDSLKSSSSNSSGSPLPSRKLSVEVDPKSREEANERERKRTKLLNDAFKELRKHLPHRPADKMSKIKTLQITAQYMHYLTKASDPCTPHKTTSIFSAENVAQLHALFNAKREMEERGANVCSPTLHCPLTPPFPTKFGGVGGRRNQGFSGLVKKELFAESVVNKRGQWPYEQPHNTPSCFRGAAISNSSTVFDYINNNKSG